MASSRLMRAFRGPASIAASSASLAAAHASRVPSDCDQNDAALHEELEKLRPGEDAMRKRWEIDIDTGAWPSPFPMVEEVPRLRREAAELCTQEQFQVQHSPKRLASKISSSIPSEPGESPHLSSECIRKAFDLATVLAFQDVDSDAGYKIYEALASAGDAQAMTAAGYCKLEGIGELDIDEREAIRWLKLAAEHGDAEGIYKLALAYYTTYEEPGTNSDEKALELFSRSREKEHVEGAFMLGQMLLDKGDAASAVPHLYFAGEAGHWGARELLLNLLDEDAKARG